MAGGSAVSSLGRKSRSAPARGCRARHSGPRIRVAGGIVGGQLENRFAVFGQSSRPPSQRSQLAPDSSVNHRIPCHPGRCKLIGDRFRVFERCPCAPPKEIRSDVQPRNPRLVCFFGNVQLIHEHQSPLAGSRHVRRGNHRHLGDKPPERKQNEKEDEKEIGVIVPENDRAFCRVRKPTCAKIPLARSIRRFRKKNAGEKNNFNRENTACVKIATSCYNHFAALCTQPRQGLASATITPEPPAEFAGTDNPTSRPEMGLMKP